MSLKLYEELVTPTGGQKSEGVQKVLGQPPMNWITIVLREAVQNSWDARQSDGPVEFEIRWWRPTKEQKIALRDKVFTNEPEKSPVRREISNQDFDVMVLSDRGTKGLSGPVLANEESLGGEKRNFVDFVWEIGRSEGAGPGGGTYGYGKTSFFRLSRVRAVCVHSRCVSHGKLEDRFIAAYLGPSSPKRTGRAWWGDVREGEIRPLIGSSAAELAAAIGMPPFPEKLCGTSIMILSPRVDDLSREDEVTSGSLGHQQVLQTIAESLVQWFWPKMVDLNGSQPAMKFRIFHENQEFPVPSPETVPPFNVYVEALRLLKEFRRGKSLPSHAQGRVIECLRPHAVLGHLVMLKGMKKPRTQSSGDFGEASARELFTQSRHVVLLREPMLVVKYLRGPAPPSDQMDYSGVFVVDRAQNGGDIEKAFALSEPPTHDDWVPETLEDRHHKTFVRVGLRRIKEAFTEFSAPIAVAGGAETQQALGAFSEMLGDLLAGSTEGTGARVQPPPPPSPGGSGGGGKKSRVEIIGTTRVESVDNKRCLAIPFRITPAKGLNQVKVRVAPNVLLERGMEKDPPKNAQVPRVHSFCQMKNGRIERVTSGNNELSIPASKAHETWVVFVSLPDESRVNVDLTVTT